MVSSPGTQMAEQAQLKTSVNPLLLAIPAAFDCCGSTIMFVGLTMCAASIYQMLRGFVVVVTAALAWMFLGQKQYAHKLIAIFLVISGVAVVGASSQDGSSDDT